MLPVVLLPIVFVMTSIFVVWARKKKKELLRERRRQRILRSMATKAQWNGMELVKKMEDDAGDGAERLSSITLYPELHELELDGLVRMRQGSPVRTSHGLLATSPYQFSLTPKGHQAAQDVALLAGESHMPNSFGSRS